MDTIKAIHEATKEAILLRKAAREDGDREAARSATHILWELEELLARHHQGRELSSKCRELASYCRRTSYLHGMGYNRHLLKIAELNL